MADQPIVSFWRSVFSEADGSASFARVATVAIVLSLISWDSFLVYKNHVMPDLMSQTPFVMSLYGANKFATALGRFSGKPE